MLEALPNEIRVNKDRLAGPFGYSAPYFVDRGYYVDVSFKCRDCGTEEVWTARQQNGGTKLKVHLFTPLLSVARHAAVFIESIA
jgi:hypothetical protein